MQPDNRALFSSKAPFPPASNWPTLTKFKCTPVCALCLPQYKYREFLIPGILFMSRAHLAFPHHALQLRWHQPR